MQVSLMSCHLPSPIRPPPTPLATAFSLHATSTFSLHDTNSFPMHQPSHFLSLATYPSHYTSLPPASSTYAPILPYSLPALLLFFSLPFSHVSALHSRSSSLTLGHRAPPGHSLHRSHERRSTNQDSRKFEH
ncbi:hypothetical protein NL676_012215 [Syzygium grande]|nr:hypothetical protein NL676_012215 [Syzygium grande]